MSDDDMWSPVQILITGRAIEIIIESLPEVVIQASIAIQQLEKATPLLYFSICSSIAAAAAIMTDTNISYELGMMNSQERGRHSNPFFGLIPDGKWGLARSTWAASSSSRATWAQALQPSPCSR